MKVSMAYYGNKGSWYADIRHGGKRKRVSLRTKDEKIAKERMALLEKDFLKDFEEEMAGNRVEDKFTPLAVRDLVDWYLHTHLELGSYAPKTKQKYAHVLMDLVFFLSRKRMGNVDQLTFHLLQEWQLEYLKNHTGQGEKGKHAPRTIEDIRSVVRCLLNAAVKAGKIDASPIKYWDIKKDPPPTRAIRPLRESELQEALSILKERKSSAWNVCRFMAYSGWRVSDVMDLRWGEIDEKRMEIDRIQIKTQDKLNYPINAILMEVLQYELERIETMPKASDHVFRNAAGTKWIYSSLYTRLTECLRTANFPYPVSCHTFRHTFATLGANEPNAVPPKVMQNLLGHKRIETTLKFYTKTSIESMRHWQNAVISPKESHPESPGQTEKHNLLKLKVL